MLPNNFSKLNFLISKHSSFNLTCTTCINAGGFFMNYLAHAYLSFNHTDILLGNMSSDFIKGKKKFDYTPGIQKGIALHRSIDIFTDAHAVTAEAKKFFKAAVGTYSGAFVDVTYDHFLAIDKNEFPQENSLQNFAAATYLQLQNNINLLPQRLQAMVPNMQSQNWLYNYCTVWGIEKSFEGVARKAVYLNSSAKAFAAFQENYDQLKICFAQFFPDVKNYAWQQFQLLTNQ